MSYAYNNSGATRASTYPGQGYAANVGTSPYLGAANPAAAQRSASPYHGAQPGIQPSVSPYPGAGAGAGVGAGLVPPGQSSYPGMHGRTSPAPPASPYHNISPAGSTTIVGAGSPMPGAYPGMQQTTSPIPANSVPPGGQLTIGPAAAAAAGAGGAQPFAANVRPGALTYTTTMDPQGRTIYHNFRCEQS